MGALLEIVGIKFLYIYSFYQPLTASVLCSALFTCRFIKIIYSHLSVYRIRCTVMPCKQRYASSLLNLLPCIAYHISLCMPLKPHLNTSHYILPANSKAKLTSFTHTFKNTTTTTKKCQHQKCIHRSKAIPIHTQRLTFRMPVCKYTSISMRSSAVISMSPHSWHSLSLALQIRFALLSRRNSASWLAAAPAKLKMARSFRICRICCCYLFACLALVLSPTICGAFINATFGRFACKSTAINSLVI